MPVYVHCDAPVLPFLCGDRQAYSACQPILWAVVQAWGRSFTDLPDRHAPPTYSLPQTWHLVGHDSVPSLSWAVNF